MQRQRKSWAVTSLVLPMAALAGIGAASCEPKEYPMADPETIAAWEASMAGAGPQTIPTESDGQMPIITEDPGPGPDELGSETPPVLAGLEPEAAVSDSAGGSCVGDAGACASLGDAGADTCIPAPRDCSSDLDNDCDQQPDNVVDDVCRCAPETVEPCEEHPGLDGRGQCRAGLRTCALAEGNLTSDWGACEGSVAPGEQDSCTVEGDDTDCDGAPNGGCACLNGATVPCGPENDEGICQRGASTCVNGSFGQCQGAVFPAPRDSCAAQGDDSNCNGIPNEGCSCIDGQTTPCGPDTDNGICQRGTRTCVNGSFGQCQNSVFSAGRDCRSAQDNDCDGRPDNTVDSICTCVIGDTQVCGEHPGQDGNGPCRAGQRRCEAGAGNATSRFGACTGSTGPQPQDLCTTAGNDANCDGTPNGGCECVAGRGNGPCSEDPNSSRCNGQGECVPCQVNADCSLISAGRNFCDGGRCTAPPTCGDGIRNGTEICDGGRARPTAVGSCNPECTGFYEERSILLTRSSYLTNLGGVAGADAICVAEFGSGYKALIVGGGRRASVTPFLGDAQQDWVLRKYTHYLNSDGALIWRSDEVALLGASGGRRQQQFADLWSPNEGIYPLAGFNDDWTTLPDSPSSQVGTCNGWSTNDSANFTRWAGIQLPRLADVRTGTGQPCGRDGPLLCVEQ